MLSTLHISNYALIEELDLDLSQGFSVITGETGAGKSIILGAIGLLQGNRAEVRTIKAGAKKCVVEGTFNIKGLGIDHLLHELDIDKDEDTLIIRREITTTGKSRTFLNDTPTTLSTLKELSTLLIDVHSQHQNLLLGNEKFLFDILDSVAKNQDLCEAYAQAYKAYVVAERQLRQLRQDAQRSAEDRDFMAFQLAQLEEAAFKADEQELLEEESRLLSHAEEIRQSFSRAQLSLQNDEHDCLAALRTARIALEEAAAYQSEAQHLAERVDSVRIELDDIVHEIERTADSVDCDPERLHFVDERLSLIYSLQRKHHVTSIGQLLAIAEDFAQKLDAIDNVDQHIAQAETSFKAARTRLKKQGTLLSESRQKAALELEAQLIESLQALGMPNVQLRFEFTERPQADRYGMDTLRFLFSANKKGLLQDVAQTASGGEIARLMLSLKALIAQKKQLPTIIFDEIDTGVSGTMAERMGRVMQEMGARAQVLCITHLPQIAALGAAHYYVHKQENEEGTNSQISPLTPEERVKEIANMLSGQAITAASLANARELLSYPPQGGEN